MSEITPEQAGKIVEWLGVKINQHGYVATLQGMFTPQEFLRLPEGEVAMLDKLLNPDQGIVLTFQYRGLLGYSCKIEQLLTWEAFSKTRNQALQMAIIEMLKGKK